MARHTFGQSLTDWVMTISSGDQVLVAGDVAVTFWSAPTGGVQYTDLLDVAGNPATSIVSSAGTGALPKGTIPEFQGPDSVTVMWADAGGGARYKMLATDLGEVVNGLVFTNDYLSALETMTTTEGTVGQYLGKDPDPDSATGVRWTVPPEPSGSGGSGGMWVDASAGAYAADKTGTLDARAVIQAAIDDVSAAGGGIVWLPRGTYLIGYVADTGNGCAGGLQLKSNVWLRGESVATRLEATGTWSSDAGIIGIGDAVLTQAVRDTRVSDLWIKGTAGTNHVEPVEHIHGLLYNTAGISTEPDAVHRIENLHIWDCDRGIALLGTDDQAAVVQRIRGRWFRRQAMLIGAEGGGGGPDNYFLHIDVSSANRMAGGTYAGIEIQASNTHWLSCKSWFNKRATAFVEGSTYKDGAGWYLGNVRNLLVACEAQDNGGHGFVIRNGKNTLTGCVADSNNSISCISGSAAAHECSGFYIGGSDLSITGAMSFDRTSTADDRYQKYGYAIDPSIRNLELKGTAWDNRSSGAAADPADGVTWIGGPAHTSHEVRVLSAYGSSRTTIANTGSAGGVVQTRQDPGAAPVTGTVLTSMPALTASVPGGGRWYRLDAWVMYRADATTNARIGLAVTRDTASGYAELDWQATYVKPDGSTATEFSLSLIGTTRYVVADGDGGVAGAGYTNQRSAHIVGQLYVGTTVNVATVAVQVAENGGTGTGVKVVENSYLTLTPANYS